MDSDVIAKSVLLDTGLLVAMLAANDSQHARCVESARRLPSSVFTCWPVVTEDVYLLRGFHGSVDALLSRLESGAIQILAMTESDVASIRGILDKYRDQGFDFADACLMHLANRESIPSVFTLDQRHFGVYRLPNGDALQLIPKTNNV